MSESTTVQLTRQPQTLVVPRARAILARSTVPAVLRLRMPTHTADMQLRPGRAELVPVERYVGLSVASEGEGGELELTPVA